MKNAKLLICIIVLLLMISAIFSVNASTNNEYEYYIKEGTAVLTKYIGNSKSVSIPSNIDGNTVKKLEGTFCDNDTIENVIIPNGITIIGEKSFYDCDNLKEVSISDSVRILDDYAFAFSGIANIQLPERIRFVNYGCFWGCQKLTVVESNAVTAMYLDESAFANSNIRIFKSKYTPYYCENTFTTNCIFTNNDFVCNAYKSSILAPIMDFFMELTPFKATVFIAVMAVAIIILMLAVRFVLSLFRINNISNYRNYSKRVFAAIKSERPVNDIVKYKKRCFFQDKLMRIIKVVASAILIFVYIWILLYVSSVVDLSIDNPFVHAAVTVLGTILITIIIFWGCYKISYLVSNHRKEADKPNIRIRRFGKGEKKHD